ncbi:MAG: hypothetical protein ACOC9Y_05440 [Chloroflexota bacterium]
MAGERWAQRVWQRDLGGGCMISAHSAEPGNGRKALLAGPNPVRAGAFRYVGTEAINGVEINAGNARRSGRLRYLSVWTRDGLFIKELKVDRVRQLRAGAPVIIPRGMLRVGID